MEKETIIKWVKENVSTWIDEQTIKTLFQNNKLIECINNCTSPVNIKDKIKKKEKVTKEDLQIIFKAFSLFPLSETRILILGQDPYTEKSGKADGCAFSVKNKKQDSSLVNIFNAIVNYREQLNIIKNNDIYDIDKWNTDLKQWASTNNVLLLNTALTHESPEKNIITKHHNVWEPFINEIIKNLISSDNRNKLVVFLWGIPAQTTFFNAIREMGKKDPDKCYLMQKMIFMTSHPSNNGQAHTKGFDEDSPIHFAACDEFLGTNKNGKYTWKDFPENN